MWFTSFTVIGEAIKSFFDFAKTNKEQQINTEVLSDKKDIEDANKQALKALKIANKYTDCMRMKDRYLFKHFYNNFIEQK